MAVRMARVLLVHESPAGLGLMQRLLTGVPGVEIAGTASTVEGALERLERLAPTVVCVDMQIGGSGVLDLVRRIMSDRPVPVLVLASKSRPAAAFELLAAGAVDVCAMPATAAGAEGELMRREFARLVKVASGVRVFRRVAHRAPAGLARRVDAPAVEAAGPGAARVVAIGASTGGPEALDRVLSGLPSDFPAPVLCVQHITAGFLNGLVDWLRERSPLPVQVARPGEQMRAGHVYFAREGAHLVVDAGGRLRCPESPPVSGHRPSVTVTFESVALAYGAEGAGVILTGMGRDGVDGMRALSARAATTIAQDRGTSLVFGMPAEAIALGVVRHVLPLDDIPRKLVSLVRPSVDAGEGRLGQG